MVNHNLDHDCEPCIQCKICPNCRDNDPNAIRCFVGRNKSYCVECMNINFSLRTWERKAGPEIKLSDILALRKILSHYEGLDQTRSKTKQCFVVQKLIADENLVTFSELRSIILTLVFTKQKYIIEEPIKSQLREFLSITL